MRFACSLVAASLVVAAGIAQSASASVVASETFSYANGNLVGNGTWAAHSGAGSNPVQVVSQQAVLTQGAGSREDVNLPFTAIGAGQAIYASFDFTNNGDSAAVVFAHFLQGTTNFRARAWITPALLGGNYTVGLSDGSTIAATWAADLTYGTTYKAVIAYDFSSQVNRLWINPVDELSTNLSVTGTAGSSAIAAFALRQAGTASTQTIDNLVIGTTFGDVIPTPASLSLLGLGGLVALRRRRA